MPLLQGFELAAREWLARVEELAPVIAAHRDEAEAQRRLPVALHEALRDAGMYRMWLPRAYGGYELDLVTTRLVIESLSRLDGSVGWCVAIANEGAAFAAYLPQSSAGKVYSDPRCLVAGTGMPPGRAVPVDGGYVVSGRWPLASGSPNATWLFGGAIVMDGDAPRLTPAGTPEMGFCFVPVDEAEILDTWYSTGLHGSGSHHFQLKDVFVPADRRLAAGGAPRVTGSIYPHGTAKLFSPNAAAVGAGIARDALDTFKEFARKKPSARGQLALAEQNTVQALVAQSEIRLQAARLVLHEASAETQAQLMEQGDISDQRMLRNRLVSAYVAQTAADVVTSLYTAAGSSAVYAGNRLDRCLRDVHTMTQHVSAGPANFFTAGQHFLTG